MGELRDQMLVDLQLSGAKPRTQKTYLREVENLAKYFNRSRKELEEDEFKKYMLYLTSDCMLGYAAGVESRRTNIVKDNAGSAPEGNEQDGREEKEKASLRAHNKFLK